jgi:hypothetical protein
MSLHRVSMQSTLRPIAYLSGLILLAGCGDARRNQVEPLIQSAAPDGLVVKKIDPRYVVKQMPDGTHAADVPVYFQVSGDRYSIRRLLSTPQGNLLASNIDAVAGWATSTLRQNDTTREQIMAIRAGIPTDTLLLDQAMRDGDEIAAILKVIWTPDAGIVAGLPNIRGQIVPDPAVGVLAGSPAAADAFDAIRESLNTMEILRERWISTADLRTEADHKRWIETFVSGAVFVGPAYRLIVVEGFDVTEHPRGVLTSGEFPVKTRKLRAKLEPIYAGGAILRVIEANEITPADPDAVARPRPIPGASTATIETTGSQSLVVTTPEAKRITLKFDRIADILPPEAD